MATQVEAAKGKRLGRIDTSITQPPTPHDRPSAQSQAFSNHEFDALGVQLTTVSEMLDSVHRNLPIVASSVLQELESERQFRQNCAAHYERNYSKKVDELLLMTTKCHSLQVDFENTISTQKSALEEINLGFSVQKAQLEKRIRDLESENAKVVADYENLVLERIDVLEAERGKLTRDSRATSSSMADGRGSADHNIGEAENITLSHQATLIVATERTEVAESEVDRLGKQYNTLERQDPVGPRTRSRVRASRS